MKETFIYLVEHNPVYGNMLKYRLSMSRFPNVRVFHSGPECIQVLRKGGRPDFIIAGTDGSEADGTGFLAVVKSLSPATSVIFFSFHEDEKMAGRLIDEGAADYICISGTPERGINELVKNLDFLRKTAVKL
jgi:DNA-binding NtrC family response regulator